MITHYLHRFVADTLALLSKYIQVMPCQSQAGPFLIPWIASNKTVLTSNKINFSQSLQQHGIAHNNTITCKAPAAGI